VHSRTLALYATMCRVADLIEQHPDLRIRAAESSAFTHFLAVVARLEALQTEEVTSELAIRAMRAQRRALLDDVIRALRRILATAAVLPPAVATGYVAKLPDRRQPLALFIPAAESFVKFSQKFLARLVEAGLHPNALDEALDLIHQLDSLDRDCSYTEAMFAAHPARLADAVSEARKRVRQLFFELWPAMTLSTRAEWRSAAALGRVHRSRALSAGEPLKQLPAATPQ